MPLKEPQQTGERRHRAAPGGREDLCPWAARSLREGRVWRRVLTDATPAAALEFVDALEATPEVDIGLLIFPRLALDPDGFDHFAEDLRQADRRRRPPEVLPEFVLQAFHPDGAERVGDAYQAVSFIRRSPDPTIQFVRYAVLDEVRRGSGNVGDEIARRNFATVTGALDRIRAVMDDIRRDREASYARL